MPETEWNSATPPNEGEFVRVLAQDRRGEYVIPFPILFRDNAWWNPGTGEQLTADIVGWRPMTASAAPTRQSRARPAALLDAGRTESNVHRRIQKSVLDAG
jgi:hypothetical protein